MSEEQNQVALPIVYVGAEDVPILFANQFVIQHSQQEFFLTVGPLQPPILLGKPEEVQEQVKRLGYVPVKVVARLALTEQRLRELIKVLEAHLTRFDEAREEGKG